MGCSCGQGLRFAFKELDIKTKPFLQLSALTRCISLSKFFIKIGMNFFETECF